MKALSFIFEKSFYLIILTAKMET